MQDVLKLNLDGITGDELVDIYLGGKLVKSDLSADQITLKGDFSSLDSLRIHFKNDNGADRVDVKSISFNGHEIDLAQGTMVRTNGNEYDGLTKMHWNGDYELDAAALNAAKYSNGTGTTAPEPQPKPEPQPEPTPDPVFETVPDTQQVHVKLAGIKGTEKINLFINGEMVKSDHTVKALLTKGQSETLSFEVADEMVKSVSVEFTNDKGVTRVDVLEIRVNESVVNLGDATMTRDNGDTHDGLVKMYWNGELSVDVPESFNNVREVPVDNDNKQPPIEEPPVDEEPVEEPPVDEKPEPEPQPEPEPEPQPEPEPEPEPEPQAPALQQVALTLTGVEGSENVNFYINGELAKANHTVAAKMTSGQSETVTLNHEGEVDTVSVEFTNDSGISRVDVKGVSVNGNEVNLAQGVLTRDNGDEYAGQTKLYWNGEISFNIPDGFNHMSSEQPTEEPVEEPPVDEEPGTEDPVNEEPGTEEPGTEEPPAGDVDWGGLDPNMYRGDYSGRDRAVRVEEEGGQVIHIATGTSADKINSMVKNADPNTHLTLDFAAGEHWFNEQILIERGDITVKGAGKGETTFVANFNNGDVQNLIQIQGDDIRLDGGSNNGRWRSDQSDYVGHATKGFDLGDKSLTVSSTNGLSIGDHVMVYKQGTADKRDGDDEFGSIAEITGINGNTLIFNHALAFGSDMLAGHQNLGDVKVYEMDLLENVNVHDFSVSYHVTDKDIYNPDGNPVGDLLDTTEFNFYPKYAVGGKTYGEVQYGHQRALVLSGTHEANIYDVGMNDVGSHAFFFSGNLELYADNLSVDGVYNKGVDGNGYGIEYDKTYYSDFTNLDIVNVRHSVSANMLGGNGYNNFHVAHTDSNVDFHGGRDQANIYYIEDMEYEMEWLPQLKDGKLSGDINYDIGKFQFELIEYRQEINEQENTVVFKNVSGNGSPNNDGSVYDASGDKLAAYLSSNDDFLAAAPNGGTIYAGFGNDVLISGNGNDLLIGGRGPGSSSQDMFVFDRDNGQDVIADFEDDYDTIAIVARSGISSVNDVLRHATQSGNDVVLDFGSGDKVTVQNTRLSDLDSGNINIVSDIPDFN